jgi:hypothetical protein
VKYIQVSAKLRVHRPGLPDLMSVRPTDKAGRYTDVEQPTLIDLDDTCVVDVPALLNIGAIAEVPKAKASRKGGADGEGL